MKNVVLALTVLISTISFAQNVNTKSVALEGYDLVGYFTKNQAIQGSDKLAVEVDGIHYYFSSVENQQLFKANPTKYMPEMGGFCATAVATSNAKFPVDPETFQITDGKLYLFYNGPYKGANFNGKEPWLKDEKALIKKAEVNWKTLKNS
ncbi:YHS domain-containing (seleno)protein [uncultured Aquimarina sp.]|uniref:YHS domain-containing (seleno)protein n=1 Tax=uncultured Aquimarina sp. TaxID=575652 RepID=UPI0026107483|nr:YHS domain-containing (seleno)protein [uncultured Aquimarina sp.]